MKLTNQSLIISNVDSIDLNGKALKELDGRTVTAGTQNITFNSNLSLKKTVRTENVPKENKINSVACIAILPLCLIDKAMSVNSNIEYVDSNCNASLDFETKRGKKYSINIENDINEYPVLFVSSGNNRKKITSTAMSCSQ